MSSYKKRQKPRNTQKPGRENKRPPSPPAVAVPFRRIAIGAALGAVCLFSLGQGVGQFVLPRLQEALYWSSWYFLVPGLVAPVGAILGALSARYQISPPTTDVNSPRINAPVFTGAGIIAILLPICFMLIALNNEIVQKFVLNPKGWTHNHLPSTTIWFLSYYGLPFIWALVLMWCSRPAPTIKESLD